MKPNNLTPKDIEEMSYNEIIGIIKETNRIPGGQRTIIEIISKTRLSEESKVLEIGTCTGFTSIEISRFVKSKITAIDINENSLEEAKRKASELGYNNIKFINANVNNLPLKNNEFDLVIVGNIFSLIDDKNKALSECRRVCKKDGFILVVPMYYLKNPPKNIVDAVSRAIKTKITPLYKKDWIKFFKKNNLDIYFIKSFEFDCISDNSVTKFVENILQKPHLKNMKDDTFKVLKNKYGKFMLLFRDNLSYMGYSIILLNNNRIWNDPELFTSRELYSTLT